MTVPIHDIVEGKGPYVTLIHGVGADLTSWDAVVPALAPYFTVVRLDLRGHGRSGPITECRLDDFCADIREVWRRHGIERSHVVGFSLGGLIAQALALADPERIDRLVILSAVAGRSAEERERVVSRLALLRDGGIAAVTNAAEERWFTPEFRAAHPDKVKLRIAQLLANDPVSYAQAYTVFATSDLADHLHEIRHPTLIATGENDSGSNVRMARLMHERIAGSELRILPRLRHSILMEAPEATAELLLDFLRR
jgi:(E)-2-((N-methylformamido)methylene)succinate hydrolase